MTTETVRREALARAIHMLELSAEYIREHAPSEAVWYDNARCDGYCLADDAHSAASELKRLQDSLVL